MLNVREPLIVDDSLTRYEYHTVVPYSSTSYNNNDEIRIPLHQQDVLTLPSESRLYVEGTLSCDPTKTIPANEGLSSNAVPFLFSELRYELNGIEIDRVRNPGMTSLLKGLVSFTSTEQDRLKNTSWSIQNSNNKDFSFCVPLKNLLGFAEDYCKVLINVKQELILLRSRTNTDALVDSAGNLDLAINIKHIHWQIPFISVCDQNRLQILKVLQSNTPLKIPFRTWQLYEYPNLPTNTNVISWPVRLASSSEKPRFIILGLQEDRDSLKKSKAKFDSCNVRNIRLHVGSETFPYSPLQVNFSKNNFSVLYENFINFRKQYYQGSDASMLPAIGPDVFSSSYPLWVIDCSRQSEVVKTGGVDIRLDIDASKNFAANTSAYCLILNDSLIEYVPFSGIVRNL